MFCLLSEKGSALKGKNLLPSAQDCKPEVTKSVSLVRKWQKKKIFQVYQVPLNDLDRPVHLLVDRITHILYIKGNIGRHEYVFLDLLAHHRKSC